jgi:hypothetical protein
MFHHRIPPMVIAFTYNTSESAERTSQVILKQLE